MGRRAPESLLTFVCHFLAESPFCPIHMALIRRKSVRLTPASSRNGTPTAPKNPDRIITSRAALPEEVDNEIR